MLRRNTIRIIAAESGTSGDTGEMGARLFDAAPTILAAVFCVTLLAACAGHRAGALATEMTRVPGATFRMGTDASELDALQSSLGLRSQAPLLAEVPSFSTRVDDFFLDTFDVTNEQFYAFVRAQPAWSKGSADESLHNGRYLEHWTDGRPPRAISNHPVTFVTWYAADAYCAWRGKRLPTEAEYEWAAQDGTTRAEYPWGNAEPSDDRVSWGGNGIDTTVPVGSYPPNARGLYDMSGNVWRFTADPWLGSHAETLAAREASPSRAHDPSIRRVVRGGSWGANAANLRVRYRDSHRSFDAREMVGFRCAKDSTDD